MLKQRQKFQKLVEQHKDRVFSFARYYLGNAEDAEDVTQEVLLRLWHHGLELEEAVLPAWLTRVTKNACVDALRKRQTYQANVTTDTEHVAHLLVADDVPAPDKLLEAKQIRQRIEAALQKIGEPYRSIVVCREIQDMAYEQIAESLDLPLNTVKVYLHRARKMLREHLTTQLQYETVRT